MSERFRFFLVHGRGRVMIDVLTVVIDDAVDRLEELNLEGELDGFELEGLS